MTLDADGRNMDGHAKWLGEDYRISDALRPDHFEEFEGMSGDGLDATDGRQRSNSGDVHFVNMSSTTCHRWLMFRITRA